MVISLLMLLAFWILGNVCPFPACYLPRRPFCPRTAVAVLLITTIKYTLSFRRCLLSENHKKWKKKKWGKFESFMCCILLLHEFCLLHLEWPCFACRSCFARPPARCRRAPTSVHVLQLAFDTRVRVCLAVATSSPPP